jgi:hypothetical protein
MPSGLTAADQKLLRIAGVILIVMIAVIVVFSPAGREFQFPIPSTYSADSGGAKAAYLLLSQMHYAVRRWEQPPTELDVEPQKTVLILAEPLQPPSQKEHEAVANFVENGGHLVFTGANITQFFKDARISTAPPDQTWKSYSPAIPSRLTLAARKITMESDAYWGHIDESQLSLYGDNDSPVVVHWKFGRGDILWWAGSTPLTNAGISRDDNLAFFLNSVVRDCAGGSCHVLWDEYFHGQRSSPWSYIRKSPFGWGGWQLAILAIAILFTFSRRSGPTYVPAPVSRLSPLEFVDTLGGLYERAGAASSAVQVSRQHLRTALCRQLALSPNISDSELAAAAQQRLGWKDSGLGELLTRAQAASGTQKLKPSEALEIVRQLEQRAARLDIRLQSRQEKT